MLAYHLSVDLNPLAEVNKMRTCIEAYTIALCLKNGGKGMSDRAFAVGAANMNGLVVAMRMPIVFIKGKCTAKSFFIRRCPHILKHRGRVEQILNSLIIGHSNILLNFWKKFALALAPGFMLSLVRSFSMASFSSRERFSGI